MITHEPSVTPDAGADIRRLCDVVERAWRPLDFAVPAFPEIAARALRESPFLERATADDVIAWFMRETDLPPQRYRPFGQPPLTLALSEHFYLELLPWITQSTAIHDHAFAGAFAVLEGSTLHFRYAFEPERQLDAGIAVGALTVTDHETIAAGSVREIVPGPSFIHATYHTDVPSFSVVLRTKGLDAYMPPLRYLFPGVAVNDAHAPEPAQTKLRLLRSLLHVGLNLFWTQCFDLAASCDAWFALRMLEIAARPRDDARVHELVDRLTARHGSAMERIAGAAVRHVWENDVTAQRNASAARDAREYLTLRLMTPDRAAFESIARDRFSAAELETLSGT